MIKIKLRNELIALTILAITAALSLWAYPQLPLRVASHWNFQGEVDGYMSRGMHSLMLPGILFLMYITFLVMPYFDPKKERYQEFAKVYRLMRDAILFVLLGVYASATFYNLDYPVNISAIVASLIGLLMMLLGNYFGKLKRNWFIGLRTPWTLSSEDVWSKTHRLGGRLFMLWGLFIIIAPWLNASIALIVLFVGLATILIGVNLYSYLLFRQEKKK
jgi:uncharacterized membrane protein